MCQRNHIADSAHQTIRAIAAEDVRFLVGSLEIESSKNPSDALASYGAKIVSVPQAVWPGRVPTFAQVLVASDLAAQFG